MIEFLILAPILVLIAFAAYDLNKRLEERQTTSMVTRNAVYLGTGGGDANVEAFTGQAVKDASVAVATHLDPAQRQALDRLQAAQGASGVGVRVDERQALSSAGAKDRIAGPQGLRPRGDGGSSFASASDKMGTAVEKAAGLLERAQGIGQGAKILIEDGIRVATVSTRAAGDTNALQKSMALLVRSARGNEASGFDRIAGLDRAYAERYFMRSETGYHPNHHTLYPLAGLVAGIAKPGLGTADFQSRCMTRLGATDDCSGDASKAKFMHGVAAIATAKLTLSQALKSNPFTAVAETVLNVAVTELVKSIMRPIWDDIERQAYDAIEQEALKAIGDLGLPKLEDLTKLPSEAVRDVTGALPGADWGDVLGGGS